MKRALGLGLLFAACHAPADGAPAPPVAAIEEGPVEEGPVQEEPVDEDAAPESIHGFLLAKYDADGDGRVSPAEYTRDELAFARLDRDGDEVLSAADFEGGVGMDEETVRAMIAPLMIARLFETDGDERQLHVGEIEEGIGVLDANFDGGIDAGELRALAEAKVDFSDPVFGIMKAQLGEVSPYALLVAELDLDGDALLVREEWFEYFFAHSDGDDEFVWTMEDEPAASQVGGPAPGELAPDFSLRPPDGGELVQLSSFRGDRPVALIFGSYT